MTLSTDNQGIRDRSGGVNSADPLVALLYHLMRDHLPCGVVEQILRNHVFTGDKDAEYCNGYLASYAKDIADRLRERKEEK